MNTTSAVEKREKAVDYVSDEGIKVRVTYPESDSRRSTRCTIFSSVQCAATEQKKQLNDLAICRKMITVTRTLLQFSDGCAMI